MSLIERGLISGLLVLVFADTAWSQSESQRRRFRLLRPGPISRQITANKMLTPQKALAVKQLAHPQVSPDGQWIIFELTQRTDNENTRSTHLYRVSSQGGAIEQLTHRGSKNHSAKWSPKGDQIVFARTESGSSQLYLLHRDFAEAMPLTQLTLGASKPLWSPSGKQILFKSQIQRDCENLKDCVFEDQRKSATPVQAKVYDELLYRHWNHYSNHQINQLFVIDLANPSEPKNIGKSDRSMPPRFLNPSFGFDFVSDEEIVFTKNELEQTALSTNHDLYVANQITSKVHKITSNPAWDANPLVSPNGRYIAYLAHERVGFEADRAVLHVLDRNNKKVHVLTKDLDASLNEIAWSKDSRGLYFVTRHRGHKALGRVMLESKSPELLLKTWSIKGITVDANEQIYFAAAQFDKLPELYRFTAKDKTLKQLTQVNKDLQESLLLGRYEEVQTGGPENSTHGFLMYPPGYNHLRKYPLLVLIHGGPQGAWSNDWGKRWNPQLFAARGFIVALPNPRGSRGYGQSFTDAVSKNWGGAPFTDIMRFTDEIVGRKDVDAKRICAAGASYGGYMVNWIGTQTERFDCLISHAGLYNLESFWGDTEELWFPEWEFGGPPWTHRAEYRKWSPSEQVEKIQTPTMFIHGQKDYRVDLSHSLGMFTALRRRGIPARLLYFPDEGHWIQKPNNFEYWYEQMFHWLERKINQKRQSSHR